LGRYEVLSKIAEGGMAVVYLGRLAGPAGFERPVALKVVRDEYALNPEFRGMFLDEAKIVGRLMHPAIVQVHELGEEGGRLFIAMELLEGQSLLSVWDACQQRHVRLRYDLLAWLGARVAEGLHHAHELTDFAGRKLEVIHRDVNPSNIFVTYDGHPKLIDFGLAKAANRVSQTAAGVVKGKLAYMSPEQAMGRPVDRRTDVFALGVTLWELTCDRRLFKGEDDIATLKAVHETRVPDPRTLVHGYPEALWRVLERALARDPAGRQGTALELARQLDDFARSEGRVVTHATMAEAMHGLFPYEIEHQREWIRQASSGRTRETMMPPPGMRRAAPGPLPELSAEYFADSGNMDSDSATLFQVRDEDILSGSAPAAPPAAGRLPPPPAPALALRAPPPPGPAAFSPTASTLASAGGGPTVASVLASAPAPAPAPVLPAAPAPAPAVHGAAPKHAPASSAPPAASGTRGLWIAIFVLGGLLVVVLAVLVFFALRR
jgi:serine/threonine-protein kinase